MSCKELPVEEIKTGKSDESYIQRLKKAQAEVASLIIKADAGMDVQYENKNLQKCWEVRKCQMEYCPAHKSENLRCWQIAGTYCGGRIQGELAKKINSCVECAVYQSACQDELSFVGEHFNNLMHLLKSQKRKVEETKHHLIRSEKMASIGQLIAGISHELNSPLGGILGFAQFIQEQYSRNNEGNLTKDDLDKILTYVGYIEKESQRCKNIVSNLLKFARPGEMEMMPVNVNQLLEKTVALTAHQLKVHQVRLVTSLAPDLPRIVGNEQHLQQVFTNIIINAQQAMPDGGQLTVNTTRSEDWIEVAFSDTGRGIPPENLNKIFDPFFTTKPPGEGTGLGLSVSYGIVKEHKGDIGVSSTVGQGTTFTLKLPVR